MWYQESKNTKIKNYLHLQQQYYDEHEEHLYQSAVYEASLLQEPDQKLP